MARNERVDLTAREGDAILKALQFAQDNGIELDQWEKGALGRAASKIREQREGVAKYNPDRNADTFVYPDGVEMRVGTEISPSATFSFEGSKVIEVSIAKADSLLPGLRGVTLRDSSHRFGRTLIQADGSNVINVYPGVTD